VTSKIFKIQFLSPKFFNRYP